jgi:heat shock protein HtpX
VPWWAVLTAIAVAVALGVIVHWIVGVVVGVAVVATIVVLFPRLTRHASPDALAALIGGVPADEAQHPRLVNLLEQLGVSVGATTVQAKVVNCDGANIAAWGAPTEGRIAVTTGLLDTLNRVETEAVLAEALWRVRSGDAELAGLVAAFQSGQALSTSIDQPAPDDWDKRRTDLLAPFGEHREIDADLGAVGITRYPPALRSALAAMQERGTVVTGVTWGTAHLWMCDPTAGVVGLHQPVGLRLDVLAEL